jgi:hypothetical protein
MAVRKRESTDFPMLTKCNVVIGIVPAALLGRFQTLYAIKQLLHAILLLCKIFYS